MPHHITTIITDPADERIADYTQLTDVALRSKHEPAKGMYIAESTVVIRRALAAGHRPRSLLMAPRWLEDLAPLIDRLGAGGDRDQRGAPIEIFVAEPDVLHTITGFPLHRGALAAMHRPVLPDVGALLARARGGHTVRRSRIAVFENLVDHTNLGAAFRSAAALGVNGVLVTPQCADPLYRRSIRVSMGTVFQVPWTRIDQWPDGVEELTRAGYIVAGMTLGEGAMTLDELVAEDHDHLALVFGSEGHGLMRATDGRLDRRVTIPMMGGVDSLNVAASSAVAFYATRA